MKQSGKLQKIFDARDPEESKILMGHETIMFDQKGQMYAMTDSSLVIKVNNVQPSMITDDYHLVAETEIVAHLGHGRPLGGAFDKHGWLYVADAVKGLMRVKFPRKRKPVVEILASRVELEDGTWSQILVADDVAIGPKTGMIYFTDACHIPVEREGKEKWDIMYASKLVGLQGSRTGRLLRYDPNTGKVDLLATGMHFANGIAVDKDEKFVVIAETFQAQVRKYHLVGERKGKLDVLVNELPGLPDGADCSHENGKCYVVIPSAKPSILNLVYAFPPTIDRILRGLAMAVPKSLSPKPKKYGCVVEISPESNKILRILQDPKGDDIAHLYGVTVYDGKLYFGSLVNDYIGVYDLS